MQKKKRNVSRSSIYTYCTLYMRFSLYEDNVFVCGSFEINQPTIDSQNCRRRNENDRKMKERVKLLFFFR